MQSDLEKPSRRPPSTSVLPSAALAVALAVFTVSACSGEPSSGSPAATASAAAPSSSSSSSTAPAIAPSGAAASLPATGDAKHGAELAVKLECSRCHDGVHWASTVPLPEKPAAELTVADFTSADNKHCYHCHAAILDGRYKAPKPSTTARWKKNVETLRDVPTLTDTHKRFRRDWVEGFLLKPHDLRPRLAPTMPRLALTKADARDLAAFLVPEEKPQAAMAKPSAETLREGRGLFERTGCVSCHVLSGTDPFKGAAAAKQGERGITAAVRLAPDLRHARERMSFDTIVQWIKKPSALKRDALMPETPLSADELHKIASFVAFETLAPEAPKTPPARLPVLTRQVAYEEVKTRVFNKICWHCHSDADYAIGDGGPGNTGGFGFPPRGLNLAAHDGILSGSLDDNGERRSIFEPMADGTPRLVASLVARWSEEAGSENPAIRGMPLGLPGLPPEDLQIVETWIAQGHSPD